MCDLLTYICLNMICIYLVIVSDLIRFRILVLKPRLAAIQLFAQGVKERYKTESQCVVTHETTMRARIVLFLRPRRMN